MPSPEGSTVQFRRAAPDVRPRAIQRFARKLQTEIAGGRPFDTLITGDAELRKLNRDFCGNDYATDVLSFPGLASTKTTQAGLPVPPRGRASHPVIAPSRSRLSSERGSARVHTDSSIGDVAISLARARAQARAFGHSPEQEVRILMLHGLLHLLGMDHVSDGGRMARVERRWRVKLGLPNGLIDRASSHRVES